MVLYDNVKQACREKGVSVSALEKAVGFSNGCISKWNESEPGGGLSRRSDRGSAGVEG